MASVQDLASRSGDVSLKMVGGGSRAGHEGLDTSQTKKDTKMTGVPTGPGRFGAGSIPKCASLQEERF